MAASLRLALIAGFLGIGAGVFLGESTVNAMQVRRAPDAAYAEANTDSIDQGMRWALNNHPADADACPQTTLLFQWGCVMASTN